LLANPVYLPPSIGMTRRVRQQAASSSASQQAGSYRRLCIRHTPALAATVDRGLKHIIRIRQKSVGAGLLANHVFTPLSPDSSLQ
jgi:hypothetical protein